MQRNSINVAERSVENVRPNLLNNNSLGTFTKNNQTLLRPIELDDESRNSTNNAKVYSIDA